MLTLNHVLRPATLLTYPLFQNIKGDLQRSYPSYYCNHLQQKIVEISCSSFFTKISRFSRTSWPSSFFSGWYPKGISLYRTKYSSFPIGQSNLPGFRTPHRRDVSGKSGALLVYVNSNIPPKGLKARDYSGDTQVIYVEINLKKHKMVGWGNIYTIISV